ncbi:MAG: PilZ domain-containing protein [Deltaproteobacteria bacterium]|nr:PilZ domain-containing protein [Deltaproteobacteria bacterium]
MTESRERRLYPRRMCRTRVVFEDEFGEGLFYVYSKDVSEGGLSLESSIPVRLGSLLFLSWELPGERRILRATGKVVRSVGGGVGIQFVELPETMMKPLHHFLGSS